jgi:hypothetical protein
MPITGTEVQLPCPSFLGIGEGQGAALTELTAGDMPLPSFIVNSRYGLHAVYPLTHPSPDKAWTQAQRGPAKRWADLGVDPVVTSDESRVLRLLPYPNWKTWPAGVRTSILLAAKRCLASSSGQTLSVQSWKPGSARCPHCLLSVQEWTPALPALTSGRQSYGSADTLLEPVASQ